MAHRAALRADLPPLPRALRASRSSCTTGAATATRCCWPTRPDSTAGCGRRSRPSWSRPVARSGRSTSAATATATRRPNGAYRWEEFADDALAVTHHLDLVGSRRLIAAGHSKGGAALLWASVLEPGVYPRVWTYEPVIVPTDAAILAATDNPLSAGARRRRDEWSSREEALESYASKPPLNALAPAALAAYVDYGLRERPDGTVELKCRPRTKRRCTRWARASVCSPGSATSPAPCSSRAGETLRAGNPMHPSSRSRSRSSSDRGPAPARRPVALVRGRRGATGAISRRPRGSRRTRAPRRRVHRSAARHTGAFAQRPRQLLLQRCPA